MLGAVLLALGFALGTESTSVRYRGTSWTCGSALRFEPGPDASSTAAALDQRPAAAEARCGPVRTTRLVLTWGSMGLGAMVILVGWTALREREDDEDEGSSPRSAEPAGRG